MSSYVLVGLTLATPWWAAAFPLAALIVIVLAIIFSPDRPDD